MLLGRCALSLFGKAILMTTLTSKLGVRLKRISSYAALVAPLLLVSGAAHAASATATGIDGSFITLLNDLTGMLGGNFGALVLLISLIIGVGVYAVTSNWRFVIGSLMVAFLIGYGVNIVQGIGGVTATVDMIDWSLLQAADASLQDVANAGAAIDA